jgi:hypothetical protein
MNQDSVQPFIGKQLATPNDSFFKQFSNISLYVGGLSALLILIGIIYMITNAVMEHNNIHNPDKKNRIKKKKEIEKNEQIAFNILMTGIGLGLTVAVINIFYKK